VETGTESGYAHSDYAASLAEFGRPRRLPRSGGWILERDIPGHSERDATGCYPLFACLDWSQLRADLDDLRDELVSVVLVADPFGDYEVEYLKDCFVDLVVPFKQHFVTDLSRAPESFLGTNHLRNVRRALREVTVEQCTNPLDFIGEWTALYNVLIEKHGITGLAAFSRQSFVKQLSVPGLVALRAVRDGATVGMVLWYVQSEVAYYHLGAYSDLGYELRASFALFNYSIEYFAQRGLAWLCLGGAAGAKGGAVSGLSRFKEGWATGVRQAYFCGRIFDRESYERILKAKNIPPTEYFPAYRLGEFS
jgi:hypothetical protein